MPRRVVQLIIMVVRKTCVLCVLACPVTVALAQGINISFDEEKRQLSLSCNNVSLKQLATSLEQQTGIKVMVYPEAEKRISANFKNLPLDRAFERIGDGSGRIFYFSKAKMEKRLVAVHFLDASTAGGAASNMRYKSPPSGIEYSQQSFEQESESHDHEDGYDHEYELMPDILPPPGLTPEYREEMPPQED